MARGRPRRIEAFGIQVSEARLSGLVVSTVGGVRATCRCMPPTLPFWIAFITTVLLLVASLVTGLLRKRRVHLFLGPATIVSLAVAIVLTEQLLRNYEFPADALAFHLIFAKAGGLLALPVVATGVWLWRSERARVYHRVSVVVWLVSVLIATGTGLWMFSLGELKAG